MKITKIAMASSLVASSLMLQACTDEEVALGVGVVIGGVIGHQLGKDDHHHHDEYDRHDRHRRDRDHRRDRRDHRDGRWHRPYALTSSISTQSIQGAPDAVGLVARKYNISEQASEKLVAAMAQAENGDQSALNELGLDQADLTAIYENRPISVKALSQLSEKLEMSFRDTALLMLDIKADVQLAKAKLSSEPLSGM
jgi:hypothetical protein